MTFTDYLKRCAEQWPKFYSLIDVDGRAPDGLRLLLGLSNTFEGEDKGGRGDSCRDTQARFPNARQVGIDQLLALVTDRVDWSRASATVLDALGGNGTIARFVTMTCENEGKLNVLTGDISPEMIEDAFSQELPAIRQSAKAMFLRGEAVDGILFAYDTHHIALEDRVSCLREARRVIRSGGRVVIHDFNEGSPSARWYSEVVDQYTHTGHRHRHFNADELVQMLRDSGFLYPRAGLMYDPFRIYGNSPQDALFRLTKYLIDLFSLERLRSSLSNTEDWVKTAAAFEEYTEIADNYDIITRIGIRTVGEGDAYYAELPRLALVGVGTKA